MDSNRRSLIRFSMAGAQCIACVRAWKLGFTYFCYVSCFSLTSGEKMVAKRSNECHWIKLSEMWMEKWENGKSEIEIEGRNEQVKKN